MLDPTKLPLVQWALFLIQVLTLIAIGIYVWKTAQMATATRDAAEASVATVKEMRTARREATAPRLALYFASPSTHLAEIVLENAGETTAADVTCSFDPPLRASDREQYAHRFFETPKVLPPRSRMAHAFDSWPSYFGAKLPLQYNVTIRYRRIW